MNLDQAKVLVSSYTPERYTRELPDKLLRALAKAPIMEEKDIDRLA
jgi:hypothetical protein